jgi:hypothetical protein
VTFERQRAVEPAINRMTADERAIFVRCLATALLSRVLDDLEREPVAHVQQSTEPEINAQANPTSDASRVSTR